MVEFAVGQKPLHKVDVFVTRSAGAAEHATLGRWSHFSTRLHGLAGLVYVTTAWFSVGGKRVGGEMMINEGRGWSHKETGF